MVENSIRIHGLLLENKNTEKPAGPAGPPSRALVFFIWPMTVVLVGGS
jgi:hypothetical protein